MMDKAPPGPDRSGSNLPEYSVGEISAALKRTVESEYGHVRVRGEISGFKRHGSGHLYLTLKDETAVLDAVCWRGTAGRLGIDPEDGLEVIVTGRLTTYGARSKYQLVIEAMEIAGEGALLKQLEDRRRKLAAEGLFDEDRKSPIPFLPETIGIVTSPTGAVIRDILHRLADRFPRHVLLWPVAVQGAAAAAQIAAAIEGFNRIGAGAEAPRPDVLIVARGGGSLEDLWAFNEEVVVRAAGASAIPLISAVGHETDTTLIDFASDRRAPTPSAAAEMAVPVRAELLAQVLDDEKRIVGAVDRLFGERRMRLEGLARGLPEPIRLLETAAQRLDDWSERLRNGLLNRLERSRQTLARLAAGLSPAALGREIAGAGERLAASGERLRPTAARLLERRREGLENLGLRLESVSYNKVLERGFALVRDAAGQPVLGAGSLKPGQDIAIRFHDGEAPARISGKPAKKPDAGKKKPAAKNGRQGELL
ncbi:MAG: exodeoxyribonuclease VII large subunit [Alphaproteobacteria bacterium]